MSFWKVFEKRFFQWWHSGREDDKEFIFFCLNIVKGCLDSIKLYMKRCLCFDVVTTYIDPSDADIFEKNYEDGIESIRNSDGENIIHVAATYGRLDLLLWLLQRRKVEIELLSMDERNILHFAATNKKGESCEVINQIYRNASSVKWERMLNKQKSTKGLLPIDVAIVENNFNVVLQLCSLGAILDVKSVDVKTTQEIKYFIDNTKSLFESAPSLPLCVLNKFLFNLEKYTAARLGVKNKEGATLLMVQGTADINEDNNIVFV